MYLSRGGNRIFGGSYGYKHAKKTQIDDQSKRKAAYVDKVGVWHVSLGMKCKLFLSRYLACSGKQQHAYGNRFEYVNAHYF